MQNINIQDYLKNVIRKVLEENYDFPIDGEIILEHPADQDHGDFSSNFALTSFAQLKTKNQKKETKKEDQYISNTSSFSNPYELAQVIAKLLNEKLDKNVISKIEAVRPGFINFYLSDEYLKKQIIDLASNKQPITNNPEPITDKKIIVEYSSPNIAKPFTIGHLRSTIIGDSIANIYEALGWQVYRDNHLGDWGTQFGKQIYAIKTWGDEQAIENSDNPVKELVELYVKFHQEAEKDPSIEDEGRAWFKKLENGDPEARRLWQKCVNWSLKEFQRIYQILGIQHTENNGIGYGESFFEDKMSPVIKELEDKKLLKEGEEGAKLVYFPNDEFPPMMILKKDGTTLYATRDLATDKFRLEKYGHDILVVNEVGAEQSLYFRQLYKLEEILGWFEKGQRVHVGHGLYRFKDKKMSTRKGNTVWLEDVFLEASKRVEKRAKDDLADNDINKIAIGALKWNDLKREAKKEVVFDLDEILSLDGNSGPYLQYTYVRCLSVLNKATNNQQPITNNSNIAKYFDTLFNLSSYSNLELNEEELDILRNLYQYSEVVNLAAREFAPHHICTYLYSTTQKYNKFYNMHKIIEKSKLQITNAKQIQNFKITNNETMQFRILLTMAVANVLQHGLGLLGIETVEKM